METFSNVHEYISSQENSFRNQIPINDSWSWSMYEHIKLTTLYKNGQLRTIKNDYKPVLNITLPLLRLQYRAEGFDVKDITIFVDSVKDYFKSFLVRKFHEKWARENSIDTVIDAMVESYIDYGGALLKNVNDVKPEVVPWASIAFCDQTDIMSGPICIKHYYSPDQLLDMAARGWGDERNGATATLEETLLLSREEKRIDKNSQIAKTPGRYIEVYEIHGNLPNTFLDPNDTSLAYTSQIQIVCFYQKKDAADKGFITLYKSKEIKSPFKFISRDPIYGRALGMGGAEELFEPQVWTNYNQIRIQDMLDAASKTIIKTTDPTFAAKNKLREMDNLSIVELAPGSDASPLDTFPRNLALFEKSTAEWYVQAQRTSGASDALLGEAPSSGTPFALQNLVTQQGQGEHDYRKGKLATFWDEVERDWIIPWISREIQKEHEFLAELDLEELQFVVTNLQQCEQETYKKQYVLDNFGVAPTQGQVDEFNGQVMTQFKAKGNKHFVQILKGEMKDVPLTVRTNVAGKQKDLVGRVEKLSSVFRTVIGNPYILQSPPIAKLFNMIVEASGLEPIDLSGFNVPPLPTRRMTETIDYKDLQPQDQKAMLQLAGIDVQKDELSPYGTSFGAPSPQGQAAIGQPPPNSAQPVK